MDCGTFMPQNMSLVVWKKLAGRNEVKGIVINMKIIKSVLLLIVLPLSITDPAFAAGMLPDTGQSAIYAPGDDGYYQSSAQMSFTDTGNGTIIDNRTGLIWIKEPPILSYTWESAISACENLTYGNSSDWRLPNINELTSIFDYQSVFALNATYFVSLNPACYWSSTTASPGTGSALMTCHSNITSPQIGSQSKSSNGGKAGTRIRCVRGGL